MPSELLVTLFKNMIPISNFQHMVLVQNYPTAKESFQRMAENGRSISHRGPMMRTDDAVDHLPDSSILDIV